MTDRGGFYYCLNQEKYLKVFLQDGYVPLDNNAAEGSINGFCIGKHIIILNLYLLIYQNICMIKKLRIFR
ncbi:MAG: transposase [Inconstantimicrobium porci]|uniref:Transposase n=1 Tax=Inconstantimicrobium porci TaxID=2652291 RepID=A0A7X2MZH9_9CLOT|nr:transposase [Inconstantimicrobium porci]MDD6771824.1 transposase [Inconstantimicrobium porci]MSR91971.1 transposase [Inconstantimicrobium porci]